MSIKTIVLTYGSGGHQEQMRRLANLLAGKAKENIQFVAITDAGNSLSIQSEVVEYIRCREIRDKQSSFKTLCYLIPTLLMQAWRTLKVYQRYNVVGVISTGPGVSLLPTFILHCLGVKTVGLESWSRFSEPSISGRLFYKFVSLFYVQNITMKKYYKSAIYKGRL
ncbi:hypothetical protein DS2_17185 [Catenovulum agarivorans DS-2]|uniref:Polysaccharide biosynthesis protein n=1 Tax=Catenovulum agarivorans DS-2 TaxID=1328313 RepID=W7QK53_9ALTE|nr:PssD/Cps14F family polysaccharide biosynthesis glycosyltransferase [Catenovulum agarivorans]EWH08493.1 hypothetical protein DS2_17185 [Catenovulum agarivorans DS-2]